jgi:hypothetical protein
MKKNMGTADRVIRTAIAVGVGVLYFTGRIGGTVAVVLGIIALVFLATSSIAWCPAYHPLGLSTCKDSSGSDRA